MIRKIIYLIIFCVHVSCVWSSEKPDSFTGTITFITDSYPQPTSVNKIDLTTLKTLEILRGTSERPYIRFFQYSPDNRRFVFTMGSIEKEQADTEIYIGNDSGKEIKRITENNIFEGFPEWSPDGKHIVFMRGIKRDSSRFWIIDLETMKEYQIPETEIKINQWANLLPDGKRLIANAGTNINTTTNKELTGLAEVNITNGSTRWLYKNDVLIITPVFSPDMSKIAFIEQPRQPIYNNRGEPEHINHVQIFDVNTETMSSIEGGPGTLERDLWPIWSSDKTQLAWVRTHLTKQSSRVFIYQFKDKQLREILLPEEAADGYVLLWSPDGQYLGVLTQQQRRNYTLRIITIRSGNIKEVFTSKTQILLQCWNAFGIP